MFVITRLHARCEVFGRIDFSTNQRSPLWGFGDGIFPVLADGGQRFHKMHCLIASAQRADFLCAEIISL